jgi:tripartite-type tricarboxylate transporter receptor subunit TctC
MVAAPAGTPGPVTQRLGAEIRDALKDPEARRRLASIGQSPLDMPPAETAAFLKAESARYKAIVEKGGVTRE